MTSLMTKKKLAQCFFFFFFFSLEDVSGNLLSNLRIFSSPGEKTHPPEPKYSVHGFALLCPALQLCPCASASARCGMTVKWLLKTSSAVSNLQAKLRTESRLDSKQSSLYSEFLF